MGRIQAIPCLLIFGCCSHAYTGDDIPHQDSMRRKVTYSDIPLTVSLPTSFAFSKKDFAFIYKSGEASFFVLISETKPTTPMGIPSQLYENYTLYKTEKASHGDFQGERYHLENKRIHFLQKRVVFATHTKKLYVYFVGTWKNGNRSAE